MGIFDSQIATAQRLIQQYGQAVTWQKDNRTVSTSQPWKADSSAPVTYPVSIVFLEPSGGLAQALFHLMKGSDVPVGAPRGLMSGSISFTPELNDSVDKDGEILVISSIQVVAPNGTPILYKLEFS